MSFQRSEARPYTDLATVGIAIRWYAEHDQVHMGALHRLDDGVQLCHLRFHHELARELPEAGYHWDDCAMFSGSTERVLNGRVFAAFIAATAENPNIPYGFAFEEDCFSNDGTYLSMEIGKGLTCATYIIALFHSFGYEIVDLASWKARTDDAAWQTKIIDLLKSRATPEHIQAASAYVNQFRYRPEEVAAAAVHPSPPLSFEECERMGREILELITH